MAKITKTNPRKLIAGASFTRLKLKMSGSKYVSVEPGPIINANPAMIATTPAVNRM